jgi:hypothetical protein
MPEIFLIWWLGQCDYERIQETGLDEKLPEYIFKEFRSRCSRNGRGRLWVSNSIPIKEIDWDDTKPLASVAGNAGGIVIREEDVKYIAGLPGFITDTALNLWMPK